MRLLSFVSWIIGIFVFSSLSAWATAYIFRADPFFTRWDRAKIVAQGTIKAIEPAKEKIKDEEFEKFSLEDFRVAKFQIEKVWKGNVKPGDTIDVHYLNSRIKSYSKDGYLTATFYTDKHGNRLLLYLREIDNKNVAAGYFGGASIMEGRRKSKEPEALDALIRGVPENELIDLLDADDKWHYKKQLRDKGKIER